LFICRFQILELVSSISARVIMFLVIGLAPHWLPWMFTEV